MKKVLLIMMCFIFIALISIGCEMSKEVISVNEFSEKMISLELTLDDVTHQFEDGSVENVIIAYNDDFQIEFFVVSSEELAILAYEENKASFKQVDVSVSSQKEVNIGNYSTYSKSAGNLYMVVSRIDNTFIYVATDDSNKKAIESIMEGIGY